MSDFIEFLLTLLGTLAFAALVIFVFIVVTLAKASAHAPTPPLPCLSYVSGEPRPPSYCNFKGTTYEKLHDLSDTRLHLAYVVCLCDQEAARTLDQDFS